MVAPSSVRLFQQSLTRLNKAAVPSNANSNGKFFLYLGGMTVLFISGFSLMWETYYQNNKIKSIFASHDIGTEHTREIVHEAEARLHA